MSFSEQRKKMTEPVTKPFITAFEAAYLERPELGDDDAAVERLVDRIRESTCLFAFKTPLGREFCTAKDHALNCLDIRFMQPRKVKQWINDCLHCMDCVLLVYIRDVLHDAVPVGPSGKPKERDVYDQYQTHGGDLARVGQHFHNVYQKRSELEHVQIVTHDGHRQIRDLSTRKKMRAYEFAVEQLASALQVVVPLYRAQFPNCCTDAAAGGKPA